MTTDSNSSPQEQLNKRLQELMAAIALEPVESVPEAIEKAKEANVIAKQLQDEASRMQIILDLARFYAKQGLYKEGLKLAREAVDWHKKNGNQRETAAALNICGVIEDNRGAYAVAIGHYRKALEIAEQIEFHAAVGHIANNLGLASTYLGVFEPALEFYERSLAAWKRADQESGLGNTYLNMAIVHQRLKDYDTARALQEKALILARKHKNHEAESSALRSIAKTLLTEGDHEAALPLAKEALEIVENSKDSIREGHTLEVLGSIYQAFGREDEARSTFQKARSIYEQLNIPRGNVSTAMLLMNVSSSPLEERKRWTIEAVKAAKKLDTKIELAESLAHLSKLEREEGQFESALLLLDRSHQLEREAITEKSDQHAKALMVLYELEKARNEAEIERLRSVELKEALKEVEKQKGIAEEESRQKTEFLNFAAHDLRNMTAGILSGLEMLGTDLKGQSTNPEINSLWDSMVDESNKLHYTLSRLLDASIVHGDSVDLQTEKTYLNEVIASVHDSWRLRARTKDQTIVLKFDDNPLILADIVRLQEIIANLLSNAIKYSPPDTTITVQTKVLKDHVRTSVIDCGPGLTPSDLQIAARPFQRLSARPTRGESSHGLGLFIVNKLCVLQKAEFGINSPLPTGGSEFYFDFPLAR